MVKETTYMKEIKVKLSPERVDLLTELAGGRNHRAAYVRELLYQMGDEGTRIARYLELKALQVAKHTTYKELAELQEIGLKLPRNIIGKLNRLSGGSDFYTCWLSALIEFILLEPAIIHERIKPRVSAPRPNFKPENSNLPRKSKSPRRTVG